LSVRAPTRALALALALAACAGVAQEPRLRVVATSSDLAALATEVGGDLVQVETLASPEQDPHAIEVKPSQLARLKRADLVVKVGLDHEPWLARLQTPAPVVDASRGVRLLQSETPRLRAERAAHLHAFGNTHYWLDPENATPVTASILYALARRAPAAKPRFEANRAAFLQRLEARLSGWIAALAPYRGTRVVVIHDSWIYFTERFGLAVAAAAEPVPGVPPSAAELATLFQRMREARVRVVIADGHSNPELARQITAHTGARVVTLVSSVGGDPQVRDFVSLFDVNVGRLAAALGTP